MAPYTRSNEFHADPITFLSVLSALAIFQMLLSNASSKKEQELKKQLEMAHKHQELLEQDIDDLQSSLELMISATSASHNENVEDAIVILLQHNPRGLKCSDILKSILPAMPDMGKKSLNSILYKMNNRNIITKKNTTDIAPTWILCA